MSDTNADAANAPTDEARTAPVALTDAEVATRNALIEEEARANAAARATHSRLYRCYGCRNAKGTMGLDFASTDAPEEVKCPSCGIKKSCPRIGHKIEQLVVMHFEPPYPHPELGKTTGIGHLACDPTKATGGGRYRYTGERSVVNCPACQASEAYVNGEAGVFDPAFDLPITPNGVELPAEPITSKGGG